MLSHQYLGMDSPSLRGARPSPGGERRLPARADVPRWHVLSGLMITFRSVRDDPRFAGEDLLDHGTEELERTVLELRIETVLVVLLAELHAIVEPLVAAILFTGVPHATHVRGVVVLLEFGVDLDDPGHSFRHVRRDDCCRERAMRMWRVRVTDVMQECRHDVLDRSLVVEGPSCRLQ